MYGAWETNGLEDGRAYHESVDYTEEVALRDDRLVRVTRLRLVSDPGHPVWDLSYCHGELKDGRTVQVQLPSTRFSKKHLKTDIVTMCKREGVFAKGLGLLNDNIISKCQ